MMQPLHALSFIAGVKFLRFSALQLCLRVPDPTFVSWPRAQIPCLDQKTLSLVHVVLVLDLFNTNLHAIFGEYHILRLHLIIGGMSNLRGCEENVVGDKCKAPKDEKENKKWEEFAIET